MLFQLYGGKLFRGLGGEFMRKAGEILALVDSVLVTKIFTGCFLIAPHVDHAHRCKMPWCIICELLQGTVSGSIWFSSLLLPLKHLESRIICFQSN